MGDPRKQRKKYTPPSHPWQRARIDEEKQILKRYSLRRKIEVWKMSSAAKRFAAQTKKLISNTDAQSLKEKELLLTKLKRLGFLNAGSRIEEALGITTDNILDRRLQTIVYKKQLARSAAQARQFIVHGHIAVGQKKITAPSYLVSVEEEHAVQFSPRSMLAAADHPERFVASETPPMIQEKVVEKKQERGGSFRKQKPRQQRRREEGRKA